MLFRKINTDTGMFIEDVLLDGHPFLMETNMEIITDEDGFEDEIYCERPALDEEGNPILDPQYIAEPVPPGFYWPRWDGEQWVEGGQAPEPHPQPPSEEQRLAALEDAIMMLTLMSF